MNKKLILISLVLITLLTISTTSATDNINTTDISTIENTTIDEVVTETVTDTHDQPNNNNITTINKVTTNVTKSNSNIFYDVNNSKELNEIVNFYIKNATDYENYVININLNNNNTYELDKISDDDSFYDYSFMHIKIYGNNTILKINGIELPEFMYLSVDNVNLQFVDNNENDSIINIRTINNSFISGFKNCVFLSNLYNSHIFNNTNILFYNNPYHYSLFEDLTINNNTFENNSGKCIINCAGRISIVNNKFINNNAKILETYESADIAMFSIATTLQFFNNTLINNKNEKNALIELESSEELKDNKFINNSANNLIVHIWNPWGVEQKIYQNQFEKNTGTIFYNNNPPYNNIEVFNNNITNNDGIIIKNEGNTTFYNNIIKNNKGQYLISNQQDTSPLFTNIEKSFLDIENNTFENNNVNEKFINNNNATLILYNNNFTNSFDVIELESFNKSYKFENISVENNVFRNSNITLSPIYINNKYNQLTKNSTKITINNLDEEYHYYDVINITGQLVTENNVELANKNLTVLINNNETTIKTNNNGYFNFSYNINKPYLDINITFNGDDYYLPTSIHENHVVNMNMIIIIDEPKNVCYGDLFDITGKVVNLQNRSLPYLLLGVGVNEDYSWFSMNTDSEGKFTYRYQADTVGTNVISVWYEDGKEDNYGNQKNFIVSKKPTVITINKVNDVVFNEKLELKGKLTDNNENPLKNAQLEVTIDKNTYSVTTDEKGQFTYNFQAKTNNIIEVTYKGNKSYENTTSTTQFASNKKATKILLYPINSTEYTDNVIIKGKLIDVDANELNNEIVSINISGKTVNATMENNEFKFIYNTTTIGSTKITVNYNGTEKYEKTSTSTTFTVNKKPTQITIETKINPSNNMITITGKFTDNNNNPLRYTPVPLTINGKTQKVTTNNNGEYTYTYRPTTQTNTIKAEYYGNTRFDKTSTTTSINVNKIPTLITLNTNTNPTNNAVTINGKFTDINGNSLRYTPVILTINQKTYKATTNNNGEYKYNYNPSIGTQTIKAEYYGNNIFDKTSTTTTININKNTETKKASKITLTTTKNNDKITINGKFTDVNNSPLRYTPIILTTNGQTQKVTTNNNGELTYTINVNTGTNTIKAEYYGNNRFDKTSTTVNLQNNKKSTKITLNTIKNNDKITINGKFTDVNNSPLRYTPIILTTNGQTQKVTTNNNGEYNYSFKQTSGSNIITAEYYGNTKYDKASTSKTIISPVISANTNKKATKITLNKPIEVVYNDNVTLTGKFTDIDGNYLRYTPLILTINGKNYTTTTNNEGEYTYSYKATNTGIQTIQLAYNGNARFDKTSTTKTFTVNKKPTIITIDPLKHTHYPDTTVITGKFTDEDQNPLRYTPLFITINNDTNKITTDKDGLFNYSYKSDIVEANKLVISYSGNARYDETTTSTIFIVSKKRASKFVFDLPNNTLMIKEGSTINITGKLVSDDGSYTKFKDIYYSISNGDKKFLGQTDDEGYFTLTLNANIIKDNSIITFYNEENPFWDSTFEFIKVIVDNSTDISI